jgi:hypothetical protein
LENLPYYNRTSPKSVILSDRGERSPSSETCLSLQAEGEAIPSSHFGDRFVGLWPPRNDSQPIKLMEPIIG